MIWETIAVHTTKGRVIRVQQARLGLVFIQAVETWVPDWQKRSTIVHGACRAREGRTP